MDAPTTPARRGTFLTASWRWLAMLNFAADPAVVRPLVPAGTELDTWNGTAYLSVVGFRFLDTRVLGVAIPLHRDFDEVNLRFYVRRRSAEGWRRGVVFVKELVPRAAIAWVARAVYGENYRAVPMRHEVEPPGALPGHVHYEWKIGGRWHGARVAVEGESVEAPEGSEPAFITEHYWGYADRGRGRTVEYEVEHPRWRVWHATDASLDCDVGAVYGGSFVDSLEGEPTSAFVADGSPVVVRRGTRLTD